MPLNLVQSIDWREEFLKDFPTILLEGKVLMNSALENSGVGPLGDINLLIPGGNTTGPGRSAPNHPESENEG